MSDLKGKMGKMFNDVKENAEEFKDQAKDRTKGVIEKTKGLKK